MELFGTAGIRGDAATEVTPELALAVGRAAAVDAGGEPVVVGRDGRTTGTGLADAVTGGLASGGSRVVRVGRVPTPALAFASRGRRGVMVTASHNPPSDNGLKLFADGREYDRVAERRIEDLLDGAVDPAAWDEWGTGNREDVLADYRTAVEQYARDHGADLDGLTVAVDCGNGVSALATPAVLRALGARVVTLNGNVDGHFPGRASKPTAASLADLSAFVADGGADLGVAHDGDGDRVVFLDGAGEVVHEDTVVAVVAEEFVRRSEARDPVVVTTPNASERIDERVAAAGGRVHRVRLGALHEGMASVRATDEAGTTVVFAAEPWKHIHPELGPWIDGVASAAVLSGLVAREGLSDLREPVTERPYRKISVDCPEDGKEAAMALVAERLPDALPEGEVATEHGVRITLPDGSWVLVRASGTEPYLRVYAESDDVGSLVGTAVDVVEAAVADA